MPRPNRYKGTRDEAILGRKKRETDKFPEKHEVEALLAKARKGPIRDYMLLFLTANFGLRCAEAVSLTRDDLRDLDRGVLYVHTVKIKGHPEDRLPVSPALVPVISEYLGQMKRGQKYLFPGAKGHISERTARYIFALYAQRARIRPILSFHCLRHFCGLMVYDLSKGNIKTVQSMLRHRSEKTSWTYSHVSFEQLKDVVSSVPAFI